MGVAIGPMKPPFVLSLIICFMLSRLSTGAETTDTGVDHFGEWSPWMLCKGPNCGLGRRSRTRKVYLSFTRKTPKQKNKKAKLMAELSNKCACLNPLIGHTDQKDGDPERTCNGKVVTDLRFCYVNQEASCPDIKPALGHGRYYSEVACK